jgi:two-component system, NarL family, invasion response regulator UvrY
MAKTSPVRVILCDDHPIFREGLKQLLAAYGDISVTAEVGTGAELLTALEAGKYDIAVLDISLPDMNGLDILKNMSAAGIRCPAVILSMHPEEHYAVRALKAGAAGYIEKASVPEELVGALRKVARGGRYVSPSLAERLAGELGPDTHKTSHEALSDREYQVMSLLAGGKGIKDIALSLNLSPATVATYRARVLSKLNLQNTAELIRYALDNRVIE